MFRIFKRKVERPSTTAKSETSACTANAGHIIKRFKLLTSILTGRDTFDPHVVHRCWAALCETEANFEARFLSLSQAIDHIKFPVLVNWMEFCQHFPVEAETAKKIIAAWYLGYAGTPVMDETEDNARFIAYENALMFEATADATVIPSYAGGRTNFWSQPPKTVEQD